MSSNLIYSDLNKNSTKYQKEYSIISNYYSRKVGKPYNKSDFIHETSRIFITKIILPILYEYLSGHFSCDLLFYKQIEEILLKKYDTNKLRSEIRRIMSDFPNELNKIFQNFKLIEWEKILLEKLKLKYIGSASEEHEINRRYLGCIEKYILSYKGNYVEKCETKDANSEKKSSEWGLEEIENDTFYNYQFTTMEVCNIFDDIFIEENDAGEKGLDNLCGAFNENMCIGMQAFSSDTILLWYLNKNNIFCNV